MSILLLCYVVVVSAQLLLLHLCKSFISIEEYDSWIRYPLSLGALFFGVNLILILLIYLLPETIVASSMFMMILKMGGALLLIYPIINTPLSKDNFFIGFFITLYLTHLGIELFVRKKILRIT